MMIFDFREMFKRMSLQEICSFLVDGETFYDRSDKDRRTYNQRLQDEEEPLNQLLEKTFPDVGELNDAIDKLTDVLAVYQDVFMEIGVRAGASLMLELFMKSPEGGE